MVHPRPGPHMNPPWRMAPTGVHRWRCFQGSHDGNNHWEDHWDPLKNVFLLSVFPGIMG